MKKVSHCGLHEDIILWRVLKDVENGFYIDIGANCPRYETVTRLFYQRGWRGINVDPIPEMYQQLMEHRPEDINIQAAVSDSVGFGEIFFNGRGSSMNEKLLPKDQNGLSLVKTLTMKEVCDNVPDGIVIHFLKIDVEGHEKVVLETMDFSAYRPWIVLLESHDPKWYQEWSESWPGGWDDVENHEAWEGMLFDSDYSFVYGDGQNRFYLANEKSELADGFKYPPNHWDNFVSWQRSQWNSHMVRKIREDINLLSFHNNEHRRMEVDNKFKEIIKLLQ